MQKGNLQDAINAHVAAGTRFAERDILRLFKGTCEAVRAMHAFRPGANPAPPPDTPATAATDASATDGDEEVLNRHGEGEDDGASVPLVSKRHAESGEPIFDGDDEDSGLQTPTPGGAVVPYAHRDLKPGCVGLPFLLCANNLMCYGR